MRERLAVPIAAALAAGALSACAAPAPGQAPSAVDVRVMVKLVRASEDRVAIAAEASRVAGVPASYGSAVSTTWHALSLRCVDLSACDAAVDRLRQAKAAYEAVELDGRKRRAVM